MQFKNIDKANFNHLRIINDKSQNINEGEVNFNREKKRLSTSVKELLTFSSKAVDLFDLITLKFLGKN